MTRVALIGALLGALCGPAGAQVSDTKAQCASLVNMNEQWKGVALSPAQKLIRVQLVAWYKVNCHNRSKRASAGSAR